MTIRQIEFSVAASGAVSPALPQYGGVKGEHNETALCFMLPAVLVGENDAVRLAFTGGDGSVLSSDLIEDYEQTADVITFSYRLPQILTLPAGQLCVRVVVSRFDNDGNETEVFRSNEAVVWFDEAEVENGTPFWMGVSEMLRRTVTAKDAAVAAQSAAAEEASKASTTQKLVSQFAAKAAQFAGDAKTAKEAAETAKEAAEDAVKTAAMAANGAAESFRQAAIARDNANAYATTAGAASNASRSAMEDAQKAAADAAASKAAADSAASEAQAARQAVEAIDNIALKYKGQATGAYLMNVAYLTAEVGDLYYVTGTGADPRYAFWNGDEWSYMNTFVEKADIVDEVVATLTDDGIPAYWEGHLAQKVAAIKALQDEGGKDCFSFIVMTDMHYPSNIGKRAPAIAKRLMEECDIKYALCLGDTQTRGCHATKEELLAENEKINEMLAPLSGRLLRTQGNHDGNYGTLNGENYVYRLPVSQLHGHIYRPVGLVGDAHFDGSGTGYYIDDPAAKVRYIVLNTHNTAYADNEDGTQKYPNMKLFRFGQSQYDLVVEALNSIPSEDWAVVVAGHVALGTNGGYSPWGDGTMAGADCYLMENLLTAYQNKTAFSGEFVGTANVEAKSPYTNLAAPTSADWLVDHRIASGAIEAKTGTTVCNLITCGIGDVIRVKGVNFRSTDRYGSIYENGAVFPSGTGYVSAGTTEFVTVTEEDDGVYAFTMLPSDKQDELVGMRFAFETLTDANAVIITKNQPIVEVEAPEHGYDYAAVMADFTAAKGTLVGFFGGHTHTDSVSVQGVNRITTRCDAKEENTAASKAQRKEHDVSEQSFDVFTVNKASRTITATKIGAGDNRTIPY